MDAVSNVRKMFTEHPFGLIGVFLVPVILLAALIWPAVMDVVLPSMFPLGVIGVVVLKWREAPAKPGRSLVVIKSVLEPCGHAVIGALHDAQSRHLRAAQRQRASRIAYVVIAAALVVLMMVFSQLSRATGIIAGATEPTQIANNVQLGLQYVEQVQQTITQMNQYKTMLQNLQKMAPSGMLDSAAQQLWQDQGMNQAFMNLRTMYVNGQRITPSNIISQGFDVAFALLDSYVTESSTIDLLTSPFAALIAAFCSIMICMSFVMIGAQMALALVSGYLWVAVTPFLLGFGSLSFTRDMANNALKGGISVGMKVLCCYFVASVASQIAPMLGEELAKPSTLPKFNSMLICASSVALLAYLSFQLPKLASDLLNGTASLSAGDAATNMAGMAALAAGAGVMAGAAGGSVGGFAKSAILEALAKTGSGSISGGGGGAAGGGAAPAPVEPPTGLGGGESQPLGGAAVEPPADLGSAAGASIGGGGSGSPTAAADRPKSTLARAMDAARDTHSAIHKITPNDAHSVGMNATIGRGE